MLEKINTRKYSLAIIANQIRVHQWAKNILIFLPAIAGHLLFEEGVFIETFFAFCSFCLIASSLYIINDIHDINSDQRHPINKDRPIASGKISVNLMRFISLIMIIIGTILALRLGLLFSIIILSYFILNIIYTYYVKQIIILDLILLFLIVTYI